MRNTGAEYGSDERRPVILPELAELLPALTRDQLNALKEDLTRNGCYSPIVVNEDMVIVDGHNRQRLCEELGIPYRMIVFSFEDMLEAKQWALDTQKGRRNLTPCRRNWRGGIAGASEARTAIPRDSREP